MCLANTVGVHWHFLHGGQGLLLQNLLQLKADTVFSCTLCDWLGGERTLIGPWCLLPVIWMLCQLKWILSWVGFQRMSDRLWSGNIVVWKCPEFLYHWTFLPCFSDKKNIRGFLVTSDLGSFCLKESCRNLLIPLLRIEADPFHKELSRVDQFAFWPWTRYCTCATQNTKYEDYFPP